MARSSPWVLLSCVAASSSALADPPRSTDVELSARVGRSIPLHGQIGDQRSDGMLFGIAVAVRLPHGLAPRAELGFRIHNPSTTTNETMTSGAFSLLGGLRWYAEVSPRFRPFVGALVGFHLAFFGSATTEGPPLGRVSDGARETAFAIGPTLGAEFPLSRAFSLDLEGRYEYLPAEAPQFYKAPLPGGGLLALSLGANLRF